VYATFILINALKQFQQSKSSLKSSTKVRQIVPQNNVSVINSDTVLMFLFSIVPVDSSVSGKSGDQLKSFKSIKHPKKRKSNCQVRKTAIEYDKVRLIISLQELLCFD